MKEVTGIYIIQNKINNKCYIGQSVNIFRRFEKFYIILFNSFECGYNQTNGGDTNYHVSDETRKQTSIRMSEYQNRPEVKLKNSLSHIGKKSWKLNTKMSTEEKEQLSKTITEKYINDKTYSERVSKSTKDAMNSDIVKIKVKEGLSKLYSDLNYRKRLSDAHKGKHTKPIKCIYNDIEFSSREELRKYLNLPKTTLSRYIKNGKIKITII